MERLGMFLFRLFRALSLIGIPIGLWFVMRAPLDRLMAVMLFLMPSIILYSLARLFRRVLVGPMPEKPPRRRTRSQGAPPGPPAG